MAEATDSYGTYHHAMDNPVMFNDPMGSTARKSDVSQIVGKIIELSNGSGGRWTNDGFQIFEDEETSFWFGVDYMSSGGYWGTNGFAKDFESASKAFTGEDKYYKTSDGYIITGTWFTDGKGNRTTIDGRSGEFGVMYVGEQKTPKYNRNRDPGLLNFWAGFNDAEKSDWKTPSSVLGIVTMVGGPTEELLGFTARTATDVAGEAFATKAFNVTKSFGRKLGVAGAILAGTESYLSGESSLKTGVKVAVGLLTTFTPYGWIYGLVDIGFGLATGTSLTDRIANGIDNM